MSFSQDVGTGGGLGAISGELDANIFYNPNELLTPTFIKMRYFVNDEISVRLSTWFDFQSHQVMPEATMNSSFFAIRPGAEYHFASSDSYSVYAGLEVILDYRSFGFDTNVGVPIAGSGYELNRMQILNAIDDHNLDFNRDFRGYFSYGFVGLAGAEIYKGGLMLGTEFGLATTFTQHHEVYFGDDLYLGLSKSSTFGIDLSRIVRIGFIIK